MAKAKLFILTGLSFAGKSTLATALEHMRSITVVDPDAVAHSRGKGLNGDFLSDTEWARIHQIAHDQACVLLTQGKDVVYDTTSFTHQQREELRMLASRCNAVASVIYVEIQRQEAWQRHQANKVAHHRFQVHDDDFTMVADNFEPPSPDEHPLIYSSGTDVAAWIDEYIPVVHTDSPAS